MRANGTFSVKAFNPAALTAEPAISTALPVGVATKETVRVATMEKSFDGDTAGRTAGRTMPKGLPSAGPLADIKGLT